MATRKKRKSASRKTKPGLLSRLSSSLSSRRAKPAGKAAKVKGPPKTKVGKFFYWSAVFGVWGLVALSLSMFYFTQGLPTLETLPPPGADKRIEVRDAGGELLAVHGAYFADTLDYSEIPDTMKAAIIAIEDQRFFDHGAIEFRSILRAAWVNLKAMRARQGASTITQQLAKNLFLTSDRTLKRKIQELLLAYRLEHELSKEEILALYLNRVYFGSGAYGIDAAARRYFNHSGQNLSLPEAALLAGLVKAPSNYTPLKNRDTAFARASLVLMAMADGNFISESEAEGARQRPAHIPGNAGGGNIRYFTDWVVNQIPGLVGDGAAGPFVVYTTLDRFAQGAADKALAKTLLGPGASRGVSNGAIVILSPDGAIKAMVGGVAYQKSQFNRATQARRQTGSAFKLIVYLAGLEAGLKPDTRMVDRPVTIDGWSPNNFDNTFRGEVSLRDAFAFSLNTVAVQVSERAGRGRVIEMAKRLGYEENIPPHPSLALGAHEMTPLALTSLYAALANGGRPTTPYAILEIRTGTGDLVYRRQPFEAAPVLKAKVLRRMTEILVHAVEVGTGRRAKIGRPIAGKTGTSQDFRDAWFVGYSADYIAGVWVGNDDNSPTKGVTGGTLPADIWADAMHDIHTGLPPNPLPHLEAEDEKSFLEKLFSKDK